MKYITLITLFISSLVFAQGPIEVKEKAMVYCQVAHQNFYAIAIVEDGNPNDEWYKAIFLEDTKHYDLMFRIKTIKGVYAFKKQAPKGGNYNVWQLVHDKEISEKKVGNVTAYLRFDTDKNHWGYTEITYQKDLKEKAKTFGATNCQTDVWINYYKARWTIDNSQKKPWYIF